VLSCVAGFLKPEPAIYAILLNKLQLPPEEVLMVDDRPLHLKGAADAGLQCVLAGDPRSTMKQILRHLLMPQEAAKN
jgi:putative hydrolase of the HAD superfamily